MQFLVGLAVVGSVPTPVGVHGILSLWVAARRREIAIRTVVGANPGEIHKLNFGEGFKLTAGGVFGGLAAARVLSSVLRSFLFEVEPTDPVAFIGVGLLFTIVALSACWAPTRRAAKVDALEALRYE
jgi:putative ABC transport system permease protein